MKGDDKSGQLYLEIRSFPRLMAGGHRYPVAYLEENQLKAISIPVGSLDCSTDCYTHTDSFKFRDSITVEKACPTCKKKVPMERLFIDIGLMTFIQKNVTTILNGRYGWVNMDSDGRLIGWQTIHNPLLDALSKYVSKKVVQGNNKPLRNINYLKMKGIIRQKFTSLYNVIKQNSSNRLLTWCRANLRVDESFDGVITNSSANPNSFSYYKFVDQLGSGLTFDGKYSHINYISQQNIFIIMVCNNNRKVIDTYVADLTQGLLDNTKLRVMEITFDIGQFRNWFSTCYDHKLNVLYVIGGQYTTKTTKGGVQRFSQIKWNGKQLLYKRQAQNNTYNNFVVGRSLTASTMSRTNEKDVLLVAGGLTIKQKTTKYDLLNNMLSYTLKQGENTMVQKMQAGNFKDKIGAYSNLIQIPRVPGTDKCGALLFAGNSDFRTDIDRHQFCSVYLWIFREGSTQIPNFKCSNSNYPFLFESTGVLVKTTNDRFVIRTLIPARSSAGRPTKAYVLQYDIVSKKLSETPISSQHLS